MSMKGVQRWRLRGTGGDGPPNFEVEDGPCLRPPIFRELLLLAEYEMTKKVIRKFGWRNSRNFVQRKGQLLLIVGAGFHPK